MTAGRPLERRRTTIPRDLRPWWRGRGRLEVRQGLATGAAGLLRGKPASASTCCSRRSASAPSRCTRSSSPTRPGRNFLSLLAFYLMAVLSRRTGAEIEWHDTRFRAPGRGRLGQHRRDPVHAPGGAGARPGPAVPAAGVAARPPVRAGTGPGRDGVRLPAQRRQRARIRPADGLVERGPPAGRRRVDADVARWPRAGPRCRRSPGSTRAASAPSSSRWATTATTPSRAARRRWPTTARTRPGRPSRYDTWINSSGSRVPAVSRDGADLRPVAAAAAHGLPLSAAPPTASRSPSSTRRCGSSTSPRRPSCA